MRDIVADTYHNFAPKYQDYALQTEERDSAAGSFGGGPMRPGGGGGGARSTVVRRPASLLGHALELPNVVAARMGLEGRAAKAARDARRRRQRQRLPAAFALSPGSSEGGGPDDARELYFVGACWGVDTSLYLCVEQRGASEAAGREASSPLDACVCHGEGLNANGYFEVKGTYRKVRPHVVHIARTRPCNLFFFL